MRFLKREKRFTVQREWSRPKTLGIDHKKGGNKDYK